MPSSGLGAYQTKIHQIVFGGLFVLMVLVGVRGMMAGGTANIKLLAVASLVVGVVLALDKYYWALCLFFFASGLNMPGLPFDGKEVGCISLISVYFIRQAMRKENQIKLDRRVLVAFPVFIWICAVWIMNPTGLAILGASSIGARFYFKIVLGFLSLLILSSFRFSEKDCKILFFVVLACFLFFFGTMVRSGSIFIEMSDRGSRYEFLGALSIYTLMFSRYSLSQISRSLWKFFVVLIAAGLTVYSGKRRGFGTLIIIPFLRPFFTGREKIQTFIWAVFGAFILALAIAGHGSFYELPQSAQRSLGVIVPQFADRTSGGIHDLFREEVRCEGREVIRSNPWVGRKGFSMSRSETGWMLAQQGRGASSIEGHAYAGNWHSTWYAFACDFGLPAMILWGLFLLYALVWTYSGYRKYVFTDYALTAYIYYSYALFLSVIFSYTSGHSAITSMLTWFNYGMLIAIRNGAEDASREKVEVAA